jgi:quinolinate synthase
MKQITLPKILESMVLNRTEITVDEDVADKARAAVERMIALSQ